jgi:hypothetical protein
LGSASISQKKTNAMLVINPNAMLTEAIASSKDSRRLLGSTEVIEDCGMIWSSLRAATRVIEAGQTWAISPEG